MNEKWDILISEFRKLGGIAKNICQRKGVNGRGIFPINPKDKSEIFIPSDLMIRVKDIYLENNKIRISEDTIYRKDIRNFFNYYQDNFSWGRGGKETTELFENQLKNLNPTAKKIIKDNLNIDLDLRYKDNWNEIILKRFLSQRKFGFYDENMICPILELVNHSVNSYPFIRYYNGISTPNYSPSGSELMHNYGYKSPIMRALSYSFFCKEEIIFSFPFRIYFKKYGIKIICKGLELDSDNMNIKVSNNLIIIEGLPIFSKRSPQLPTNYFNQLMGKGNINVETDNLFKSIINYNFKVREEMLDSITSSIKNLSSFCLDSAIRYEIESISNKWLKP